MAKISRNHKGDVTVYATMWEWTKILDRIEDSDVERTIETFPFSITINGDENALDLAGAVRAAERDGAIRMDVQVWES